MKIVLQRLSEPSTWAGLGGLALLLGLSQEDWMQYTAAVTGAAGFVLAIIFGEKGETQ